MKANIEKDKFLLERKDFYNYFLEKISKEPTENGCLEWQGRTDKYGYGEIAFRYDGKKYTMRAHRCAYIYSKNIVFDDNVLHKCDNRLCCNVDHLYVGTQQDNVNDMMSRGRGSYKAQHIFGEKNGRSKLSDFQREEIKSLLIKGEETTREIANKFNVSQNSIMNIKKSIGK